MRLMASEISPHLNFLTDAAHLLAKVSPETSSYLMSRRTDLMLSHDLSVTDIERQHVCSSCGQIMIPGQGSLIEFKSRSDINKKPRCAKARKQSHKLGHGASSQTTLTKSYSCSRCHHTTKVNLPNPPPISRRKKPTAAPVTAASKEAPRPTANASSKKRAKNRKAGLQALLDQRQAVNKPSSSLGFSLSDFMRKS